MRTEMKTPSGVRILHGDHGLQREHLAFIDELLGMMDKWWDKKGVAVLHEHLPEDVPSLLSSLYGPGAGDLAIQEENVVYMKRNGRPGPSRLIDLPPRPCRQIVVVVGVSRGEKVVFMAFGSPCLLPKEWWDVSMTPSETALSAKFWMEHALSRTT